MTAPDRQCGCGQPATHTLIVPGEDDAPMCADCGEEEIVRSARAGTRSVALICVDRDRV